MAQSITLKESVLGASHARARFIEPLDTHPLMTAVHMAFSEHRPLVLSPDIVWVTIAQGLAMHIAAPAGRAPRDAPRAAAPSPNMRAVTLSGLQGCFLTIPTKM